MSVIIDKDADRNNNNRKMNTIQQAPSPPPQFVLRGGENDVSAIAFLKFPYLVSGTVSGIMKIWSFTNRRIVNENTPHNSLAILKLEFVRFYKNDIIFLSQGRDGLIKLWKLLIIENYNNNIVNLEELRVIQSGSFAYCKISLFQHRHKNEVILASPSREDDEFIIYKMSNTMQNEKQKNHKKIDKKMSTKDFKHLDGIQSISELNNRKKGMIMCIKIINAFIVLLGYESGEICVYNIENKICTAIEAGHTESILSMDFAEYTMSSKKKKKKKKEEEKQQQDEETDKTHNNNPEDNPRQELHNKIHDEYRGFSGGADNSLVVYQLNVHGICELNIKKVLKVPCKGIADIKIRRHHYDEAKQYLYKIVVCAGWDGKVRIYGFKKVRLLAVLNYHEGSVYDVCFPWYVPIDNQYDQEETALSVPKINDFEHGIFASSGKDGRIACWNVYGSPVLKTVMT